MNTPPPRVMSIAGVDPSGGAGIAADIETISNLGGYAMPVITAVTVQNTQGVYDVHYVPNHIITSQISEVDSDIGVDGLKLGMLGTKDIMNTVIRQVEISSDIYHKMHGRPLSVVIDPVMVATSGDALMEEGARYDKRLLKLATVITPNIPEAEALLKREIRSKADMRKAATTLAKKYSTSVIVKGGHLEGDDVYDVLHDITSGQTHDITSVRQGTRALHGTGCSFSSAIATYLAMREDLPYAFAKAHEYVARIISLAPDIGQGARPLGHYAFTKTEG